MKQTNLHSTKATNNATNKPSATLLKMGVISQDRETEIETERPIETGRIKFDCLS